MNNNNNNNMNSYGYSNGNNYNPSQQYNQNNNNNNNQNQQQMNYGNNNGYQNQQQMNYGNNNNYQNQQQMNYGTGYPYSSGPQPQSNAVSYGTPTYYPPNQNPYIQGTPATMPSYGTSSVSGQYSFNGYNSYMNTTSNAYQQMVIQPTSSGKSLRDYQDSDDDFNGDGLEESDGDDTLNGNNSKGYHQKKQGKQYKKKQYKLPLPSNAKDGSKEKKEVQEFDYDEDVRNMAILKKRKKQMQIEKEQEIELKDHVKTEGKISEGGGKHDTLQKDKDDEEKIDNNQVLDQTMKNLSEISKASVAQTLATFEDSENDLTQTNKKRKLSAEFSDEDENTKESTTNKPNSVITIPGTSISLQTEEEIQAWRNERKKNWLIKISNKKEEHCENLGIDASELTHSTNRKKFQEFKKDKDFIDRISMQIKKDAGFENQLTKPSSLTTTMLKRDQNEENSKLLQFIKELGDAQYLEYELTEQEKSKLFKNSNNNFSGGNNYQRKRNFGPQNRNRNQMGR